MSRPPFDEDGYCEDGVYKEHYCVGCEGAYIKRLEQQLTALRAHSELLREALTSISTALDAYGVRWCRDVAEDALLQEKGDE